MVGSQVIGHLMGRVGPCQENGIIMIMREDLVKLLITLNRICESISVDGAKNVVTF